MSAEDRVRWDGIYRERQSRDYPAPDPLLLAYTPVVKNEYDRVYRALDVAGGVGQNGLWLAAQGYTVDIIDISRVALQQARSEMAMRNLRNVNLLQVDLDAEQFEAARYDLVCVFRYLKRDLFPKLRDTIRPGGRIIYETFNRHYLKIVPEFNTNFLLEPGELPGYFANWHAIHTMEDGHIAQVVMRKPE